MSSFTEDELSKLRVVDLRAMLKQRGLPVSGNKNHLIRTLVLFSAKQAEKEAAAAKARPLNEFEIFQELLVEGAEGEGATQPSPLSSVKLDSPGPLGKLGSPAAPSGLTSAAPWSPPLAKGSATASSPPPDSKRPERDSDGFAVPLASPQSTSPKRVLFSEQPATAHTPGTPGSEKRARISFGSVKIRKYKMSHRGSLSTPSKGAYPVGLSWDVTAEEVKPLTEVDMEKHDVPTNASPRRWTEKERKKLLERLDARNYFERQASFEAEKEELRQLRRHRDTPGCGCSSPMSCGTSRCLCFKEGVPCSDDACGCSVGTCLNPNRVRFDQATVDNYRRQRIIEAPYCGDACNENAINLKVN